MDKYVVNIVPQINQNQLNQTAQAIGNSVNKGISLGNISLLRLGAIGVGLSALYSALGKIGKQGQETADKIKDIFNTADFLNTQASSFALSPSQFQAFLSATAVKGLTDAESVRALNNLQSLIADNRTITRYDAQGNEEEVLLRDLGDNILDIFFTALEIIRTRNKIGEEEVTRKANQTQALSDLVGGRFAKSGAGAELIQGGLEQEYARFKRELPSNFNNLVASGESKNKTILRQSEASKNQAFANELQASIGKAKELENFVKRATETTSKRAVSDIDVFSASSELASAMSELGTQINELKNTIVENAVDVIKFFKEAPKVGGFGGDFKDLNKFIKPNNTVNNPNNGN